MQNLTFKKEELLTKVKENKKNHISNFEKALDQFQKRMLKVLKSKTE